MPTRLATFAALSLLAGCATRPASPAGDPTAIVPCTPPQAGTARVDYCRYPADVRAFLDDRDLCDHFRGEPWPEGDSDAARERRRQIVDGVRTACAGTDRRLEELRDRYRGDAAVTGLLAGFEPGIENDAP